MCSHIFLFPHHNTLPWHMLACIRVEGQLEKRRICHHAECWPTVMWVNIETDFSNGYFMIAFSNWPLCYFPGISPQKAISIRQIHRHYLNKSRKKVDIGAHHLCSCAHVGHNSFHLVLVCWHWSTLLVVGERPSISSSRFLSRKSNIL